MDNRLKPFDKKTFEESIENLNKQKNNIKKIIHSFCSDKLSKKQGIELCHIGKFLSIIGNSAIIERTESPDFIISYKNEKIGLEHEQLLVPDKVKSMKSIQNLFDDSAQLFEKKYPECKLLANCWLKSNIFKFQKNNSEIFKREISEYIYALVSGKEKIEKPDFIEEVQIMKHNKVYFSYNPGAYFVKYLTSDILKQAIQKKEKLIGEYIKRSTLNRQWLLIVIGSTSPDAYEFGDCSFTLNIPSNFDRIYLMEDFNSKVWQIK